MKEVERVRAVMRMMIWGSSEHRYTAWMEFSMVRSHIPLHRVVDSTFGLGSSLSLTM